MEINKIAKTIQFRAFLLTQNINYKELNITHFHIFDPKGQLVLQVWPTTDKAIVQETKQALIGMSKIQSWINQNCKEEDERNSLRKAFESYTDQIPYARKLITVTELTGGALEVQINDADLVTKYNYILGAYDEQFKLKNNPEIQILEFIII